MADKNIHNQIKRTAKDSFIYLPTKVLPAVIGIVLVRVLTNIFSPAEFGFYHITLSTFGLIRIFSMMWLSSSVMRFWLPHLKENREKPFLMTVFWSAIGSAIFVAALAALVNFSVFRDKIDTTLFSLINIAIVASVFNSFFEVFVAAFRANFKSVKYSIYWIIFSVGKPLLGIALILLFGFRVEGIFLAFIFIPLILDFFLFREFRLGSTLVSTSPSRAIFKRIFSYGSKISASQLAFWILTLSDRYLIEYFTTTDQVGFYSLGFSISEKLLNFLYTILMLAAYPIIIENWENHGKAHTQNLITELTRYFFMLCTPILTLFILVPENVLLIFADKSFLTGAQVLPFIGTGIFLNGLTQYIIKGFELQKKTKHIAVLTALISFINIGLNLYLIPRIGIMGAAISSLTAFAIYFILALIWVKPYLAYKPPWRGLRHILVACSGLAFVLFLFQYFNANVLVSILAGIPAGMLVYFSILFIFGELNLSILTKFK